MTVFKRHTCPVTNCPHNHGERGLSCGFGGDAVLICLHPTYKRRWNELVELDECEELIPAPAPEPVAEPAQMGLGLGMEVGV